MAERILEQDTLDAYIQNQSTYSMVVNRRRMLPAIQDGLIPVQRRLLYAAMELGLTSPNKHKKSARLVGDVMGKYHPHGDSSIYGAATNLSANHKSKYPIFYGYGNFGSVAGAGPAAQRYTEIALSDFGYDAFISEIAQVPTVVDWLDNFDRNEKEPEYLPVKVPIVLINGAFGIGVGTTINVPSHNLVEVINETIKVIKNPKHKVRLIPDTIQPCELICDDWGKICDTGSGTFKIRGKISTEVDKKGRTFLHITSLPDNVSTTDVCDKIDDLAANKQLPMVKEVWNNIDDDWPDIIIELKNGADPGYVKQVIYAKTGVQKSFSVNFEAVGPDGLNLKRYNYKTYLQDFIDSRLNTKFRFYAGKLQQVMTRQIQVDAFIKVLSSKELDKIITMIRKYNGTDTEYIVEYMIKTCKVSDIQAKFILSRTLPQLSKGNLKKYIEENKQLQAESNHYMNMISDPELIKNELVLELEEMKKKYNAPRVCSVLENVNATDVPAGAFKIVITERNFIRKIPDVDRVNIVRKDNPKFIIRVDNRENILLFDNKGKVFNLPVHKIPITDKQGPGTDVRILVKNLTADIAAVLYEPDLKHISKSKCKHFLTVLTKSNTIKKIAIDDFLNVAPSGLMYSKIRPDDEVVGVSLIPHNLDIAICSGKKALRCKMKDIPEYKRAAAGAKAMNTKEPINGMSVFYPEAQFIVVVTKNGKFNKFPVQLLEASSRGKAGSKVIKLDSTDEILNVYGVNDTDYIRVLTTDGAEEIPVADIKVKSSIAAGDRKVKSKGIILRADVIKK